MFLPSVKEGVSLSLMEGMSYGLVPVSVELGGQAEVIEHGVSGYLIPLTNATQMTAEFTELFTGLLLHDSRRHEMQQRALQRIQRFSTEMLMQSLLQQLHIAYEGKAVLYYQQLSAVERAMSFLLGARYRADGHLIGPVTPRSVLLDATRLKSDYIRVQASLLSLWNEHLRVKANVELSAAHSKASNPLIRDHVAFDEGLSLTGYALPSSCTSWPNSSGRHSPAVGFDDGRSVPQLRRLCAFHSAVRPFQQRLLRGPPFPQVATHLASRRGSAGPIPGARACQCRCWNLRRLRRRVRHGRQGDVEKARTCRGNHSPAASHEGLRVQQEHSRILLASIQLE